MVFKSFVRFLINKFLKSYIEELDYEKLKLDLKHGYVCLEQLHLKPESLVDLNLPVTVATGYLEKLILIIPWTQIHARPTKVVIDGLFMLIVPRNEAHCDLHDYFEEKMRRVQRKVENLRKAASAQQNPNEKERKMFERIKLQVMQNLDISIRNLHISYETMSTAKLGHPFCFGLAIVSLDMKTTTNKEPVGKIKQNTLIIFKMKQINGLSIYWNTKCQSRLGLSFDEVVADLRRKIAGNSSQMMTDEMNYLLPPVTLDIDYTMTLNPGEFNYQRQAYDVQIRIERLNLTIDPKQFSDLLDFGKFQNYSVLYERCQEYRELQERIAQGNVVLTREEQERLHVLEMKLDVFNLAYIRHSVQTDMESSAAESEAAKMAEEDSHQQKRWSSWWKKKVQATSRKNCDEILVGDTPNIDVKVFVNKLRLNLSVVTDEKTNQKEILCPIEIIDIDTDFKRRAVTSNILFLIRLRSFSIGSMKNERDERITMVAPLRSHQTDLMSSELEFAPIDKKSDYRFHMKMQPLKIVYDSPTINKIVSLFDPNDDHLVATQIPIRQRTIDEMEIDLEKVKIFDLNVQLASVSLVLPANGVFSNSTPLQLMTFDRLVFRSCLDNNQHRFYKKFQLHWYNLSSFIRHANEDLHLIRRIPLLDLTFYKSIYFDDSQLVDWLIELSVREIDPIELSEKLANTFVSHIQSIPLLEESLTEALRRINLYFVIFLPETSIQFDMKTKGFCLRIKANESSIKTDILGHILKTRRADDSRQISYFKLKNLNIFHRNKLLPVSL